MQAPVNGEVAYLIAVRLEDLSQLGDCGLVRPLRPADEHSLADREHVPAVQSAWRLDAPQRAIGLERFGDALGLSASRRCTRSGNNRQLIEHHGDVLDENRIWQVISRGKTNDRASGLTQSMFVRLVLRARFGNVDRLPAEMSQLTAVERRAGLASDRDAHRVFKRHRRRSCRSSTSAAESLSAPDTLRSSTRLWLARDSGTREQRLASAPGSLRVSPPYHHERESGLDMAGVSRRRLACSQRIASGRSPRR